MLLLEMLWVKALPDFGHGRNAFSHPPCHLSLEALAVSIITRLALRMFSGLSFTVMVSLYSATCSLSRGRFT